MDKKVISVAPSPTKLMDRSPHILALNVCAQSIQKNFFSAPGKIDSALMRQNPLMDSDGLAPDLSTRKKVPESLGGKVYNVVDYESITLDEVNNSATLKTRIEDKLGKIDILGYHITAQKNLSSLLEKGFLSDYATGTAGGIAGKNIRGPGLYASTKFSDDYATPNIYSVALAVVVPHGVELS